MTLRSVIRCICA